MDRKLGRLPAVFDSRTLRLENYLDIPKLPPLPEKTDWFAKVSKFNMAGNDKWGDCGVAGAAHMIQTWTANAGRHEQIIPDKTVVDTYLEYTGGQDEGVVLLDFLKYWRKVGIAGHKVGVFAAIDPQNIISIRYANFLFGGVYMGFALPLIWKDAEVWDGPPPGKLNNQTKPNGWGGHCVNGGVATSTDIEVATWGAKQKVTMAGVGNYCEEAFVLISLEWFDVNHKTPTGFYWKDLVSDLKAVTGK